MPVPPFKTFSPSRDEFRVANDDLLYRRQPSWFPFSWELLLERVVAFSSPIRDRANLLSVSNACTQTMIMGTISLCCVLAMT